MTHNLKKKEIRVLFVALFQSFVAALVLVLLLVLVLVLVVVIERGKSAVHARTRSSLPSSAKK